MAIELSQAQYDSLKENEYRVKQLEKQVETLTKDNNKLKDINKEAFKERDELKGFKTKWEEHEASAKAEQEKVFKDKYGKNLEKAKEFADKGLSEQEIDKLLDVKNIDQPSIDFGSGKKPNGGEDSTFDANDFTFT